MTTTTNTEVMHELARLEHRMNQRIDHVNARINRLYDAGLWMIGVGIMAGFVGWIVTLILTA